MIFYSNIEPLYFLLPLIGLIVGLFATIFGGGGGFIFLPVLTLIFNVPAQTAVITSLIATLPIGFVGVYGYHKKGHVNFKVSFMFAAFGIVGTFLATYFTSKIGTEQLKDGFGIYTFLLAMSIIYGVLRKNGNQNYSNKSSGYIRNIKAGIYGLFGGAISGSFGTSGTGPVLAGLLSMQIPLKLVIGTSLAIVTFNAMSAVAAHVLVGRIDVTLIAFLTTGSIIGALMGPKVVSKTKTENKENKARIMYALVLIVVGLLMIIR